MNLSGNQLRLSFISATLVILGLSQSANGTVIYVRVSQEEVVIAADSKRVVQKPDGRTESIDICKINQTRDVYFASAGVGGYTGTGFDVEKAARQAIGREGTLLDMVRSFQQLTYPPLVKTLEIIRDRDPALYRGFLQGAASQTVFIRMEKRSPVVAVSMMTPIEDSNGTIKLDTGLYLCPGNCKLPATLSAGNSPRAERTEEKTKNFWDKGSVGGIRELMKVSIADNPRETGEPIDILRITKSGATWAQVKPGCRENNG